MRTSREPGRYAREVKSNLRGHAFAGAVFAQSGKSPAFDRVFRAKANLSRM